MALQKLRLGQKQEKNKGTTIFKAKNKGEVKGKAKSMKKIIAWHSESHVMADCKAWHG